ncbi:DeoR/GlpR family DNA-binding transcription regulator [Microbacterium xanthum]|uniref:DeoR/GlpR family DNA-binding transcription regulator n=1 Tax=Microbacterium xanthum TaxID=3079794 RepID=UPI002AD24D45|nr:DeoR/GlpR family DNA-binding transcription regulator [Microbacterium sp. KSW-48]MDZ8170760.1 DeoR/GlpR family DNA-binding transcription regulator [Microbacterium sp. KSW-48]
MKSGTRRSLLLQQLDETGSVSVTAASERFQVSPMTIRRDLLELERAGLARRVHGGAVVGRGRSYEPPILLRESEFAEQKDAIARAAVGLVAQGDSLALDTGSTCLRIAEHLAGHRNLTIVTPSLRVARALSEEPDMRVIVSGGVVRVGEESLTGELAAHAFEQLSVDRVMLAVAGIDGDFGLSDYNWEDVLVKKAMIRSAKEVIAVADSRKFDQVAFSRIAGLEAISTLVTDRLPEGQLRARLNDAGVTVIVAPQKNTNLHAV